MKKVTKIRRPKIKPKPNSKRANRRSFSVRIGKCCGGKKR